MRPLTTDRVRWGAIAGLAAVRVRRGIARSWRLTVGRLVPSGPMQSRKAERRVTGRDVARAAGVSQAAVSLVMTGKSDGRISDEQRDSVLRIAQELGYQPNATARSLRLGRTHAIALVVPNVANPFFSSVLLGRARRSSPRQRGHAAGHRG